MKKDEYFEMLKEKLLEETKEVMNVTHKDEICAELADVLEVITAIARVNGVKLEDIVTLANYKRLNKGGFDKRIYVASIEIETGHSSLDYYQTRPDQYPEIE